MKTHTSQEGFPVEEAGLLCGGPPDTLVMVALGCGVGSKTISAHARNFWV